MTGRFNVPSPKRRTSVESFTKLFPYYAGFPESFVRAVLGSEAIKPGSLIYDPWNGSGTTTSVASEMGLPSIGIDINPVMVIVAKARLLPRSELFSLRPLAAAERRACQSA
ncbi:DNA methyltransferase [Tardiphaga robiniae]|uniref:site-specific DNA-methyltransferase (adenine-specific) n=1 Tax=Tardiphaga robiniae TaxID=943830 RepID=A0A7G6U823_9BRAD|nr:DNA methyltransferase [Tardiphaga robiniae]QND75155.1 site-specific DNA-methyltransferase [Tardiphaga robiniae]